MYYDAVITFGTFDLFHLGHLNILQRAKQLGNRLVVGVSSDKFNFSKKNRLPVVSEQERMSIVRALSVVDEVFLEESMELKEKYIALYGAKCLVMGSDWEGRLDEFKSCCDVVYLPRTNDISTTERLEKIRALPPKPIEAAIRVAATGYSYYTSSTSSLLHDYH